MKFLKTFFGKSRRALSELCETFALNANVRRNFHRIRTFTFIEGDAPHRKLLNLTKRNFHCNRQRTERVYASPRNAEETDGE
jgi:hypothetical protein